jgi:hypothetical protein
MGLSSGKNLNFMKWVTILLDYVRLDHSLTGIYCRGFAVVTAHSCLRRITPAKVVTTNGSVQSARSPVQSKKLGLSVKPGRSPAENKRFTEPPVKSGRSPAESRQPEGPPVKVVKLKE